MALEFDEKTTQFLNACYEGRDFRTRRRANLEALAPRQGEVIVDIGCGAAHLCEEIARAGARVIGVDPSDAMLEAARGRCADMDAVTFQTGTADALGLPDASADGAVSVQVFEYLSDIPAGLAEAARVVRPGGRLVVGDIHFGTLVWATDDPARHDRIVDIYAGHCATGRAPEIVRAGLAEAGFGDIRIATETFTDIELRQDGIARMMVVLMEAYAARQGEAELARLWRKEQERRAAEGQFFFSVSHFVLSGVKG